MTETPILITHAAALGKLDARVENLGEDMKEVKAIMLTVMLKQDTIMEYINMQKGQKIAIIAFSGVAASIIIGIAAGIAKFGAWLYERLS